MIGLWVFLLADLQVVIESTGDRDWCAFRLTFRSPFLGAESQGRWLAMPRETP